MALSSDLISQFVKATNDKKKEKTPTNVNATVVKYNGKTYVRLDGSDLLTPVTSTVDVQDGERTVVTVGNHTATIMGNLTSPAARKTDVDNLGTKITEFDTVMAYKITTEDLEAVNATLDSLVTKVAHLNEADILTAEIENLRATYADLENVSAEDAEILNAEIERLQATFAEITDITAEELEALNADITNLQAYNAEFTYVSAEMLEAVRATVKFLETDKLSVRDAEIQYAQIDFANIDMAAIEEFFSKSGIIENLVVDETSVTGRLVGVTIIGDIIEGGTVKADKLVVQGDDGLYYKLNISGEKVDAEQTDYNSLNGSVITAKSITAEKVNVSDLVAFGATIGGINIEDGSVYSFAKTTVDNTTPGIYMDKDGQFAFGDSENFFRFYKDAEGNYKMDLGLPGIRSEIDAVANNIRTEIGKYGDYIQIDEENGSVTFGKAGNKVTFVIDNDIIRFEYNGQPKGSWNGEDFYTGNIIVEVEERAQFGNFAFYPRNDGSLMFLKVGG